MSHIDVTRYHRRAGFSDGRQNAVIDERRWAACLGGCTLVLWLASPGLLASGLISFLFSLGLMISAMRRVSALEMGAHEGSRPGLVDQFFAGGLMASLLWSALMTTLWLSDAVVPRGIAGTLSVAAASLVAFLIFCSYVIAEGVVSYVLLRAVGAGRTDMAAEIAFALHVEAKFGGLAGRLHH